MSLDAYVHCTCYKDGKTAPPPHAQYMVYDVDGYHLDLPENLWDTDPDQCYTMESDFEQWLETACEHKDMRLMDVRIGNISGMFELRHTLKRMGGEARFPIMMEYVREGGPGMLPKELEAAMLSELDDFAKDKSKEEKRFLRIVPELEVLAIVAADTFWIFSFHPGGIYYAIDGSGFLVLEDHIVDGEKAYRVRFSAVHCTQDPLADGTYLLTNIHSNEQLVVAHPVWLDPADPLRTVDLNLQFSERSVSRYYASRINDLRALVQAAMDTGNNVHWM
jgi:hypothetical protein